MHSNLMAILLPATLNDQILMHSNLMAILLPATLNDQISLQFSRIFISQDGNTE
uniref:Uncharacterized protein n=1 Tax=viral metagenome TaxID=1070528 RepID=A0A6C0C919_9ZZZZ